MAKIKHTKNELKAQKQALERFERFLPMLQLKKQQLQAEIQHIDARIEEKEREEKEVRDNLSRWSRLFSEPGAKDAIEGLVRLGDIQTDEGNIAGVEIPVLKAIDIARAPIDLFATPTWYDDAADALDHLMRLRVERDVLEASRRLVAEELRVTNQRVNLFEKVKIPECQENIRVIRIFLGDEQTAGVARAKIAKALGERRSEETA